ncbi:MAG TPA: hypothetical protein VFL34_00805 [Candidatus Sulfotelmatobacter sp.]|nr:hypothetical protein [Candidatus Sulfotelmatobacter sp.]
MVPERLLSLVLRSRELQGKVPLQIPEKQGRKAMTFCVPAKQVPVNPYRNRGANLLDLFCLQIRSCAG